MKNKKQSKTIRVSLGMGWADLGAISTQSHEFAKRVYNISDIMELRAALRGFYESEEFKSLKRLGNFYADHTSKAVAYGCHGFELSSLLADSFNQYKKNKNLKNSDFSDII